MGIPRKVSDLGELSEAEKQVLQELDTGEDIVLGSRPPDKGDQFKRVRASLIRLLLLGDDRKHSRHEKGVRIVGAWIPDILDLEGCRNLRDLVLVRCRFDVRPVLQTASIDNLFLNQSLLPGLGAERLETRGNVFLSGVTATGTVRLFGAKLGGDLSCKGATFAAAKDSDGNPEHALNADGLEGRNVILDGVTAIGEVRLLGAILSGNLSCVGAEFVAQGDADGSRGNALSADRIETGGGVFFGRVAATGTVRLLGAKLGGILSCDGATFAARMDEMGKPGNALSAVGMEVRDDVFLRGVTATGGVRLLGATLGGNLFCEGSVFSTEKDLKGNSEKTLDLSGSRISGTFVLRDGARVSGLLDLSAADIGHLNDADDSWPAEGDLLLDRCRNGAFIGGPVDSRSRLEWLGLQDPARWGQDFWPQPYEQCASVLREMGHGEDSRAVLIEKDRRQRVARLARAPLQIRGWLRLRDWVLWRTVRHGRQPLRATLWLGVFWAIGTGVFFAASDAGAIKPNSPFILWQSEWTECASREGRERLTCFEGRAPSYPTFNAFIYSADTLLPIVSLEMQEYWIPDDDTGRGAWARWYLWFHIAVGWALSLLAVAGFSGLVKSD